MSDNNEMQLGGKLGPRMAKLVADGLVYTRQRLGPHQAGIAQLVLQDFTNHVSDEIRDVMRPTWLQLAESPDTPTHLKPLFNALANERGQAWAWIGGTATGAAVGGTIAGLFNNLLSPAIYPIIEEFPNALLSPETVAASAARGIGKELKDIPLVTEANKGGLSGARLRYLIELAKQTPSVNELLTMFNRGTISQSQLNDALERHGFDPKWFGELRDLAHSDVSLADISAMWNRSVIDTGEAVQLGKRVGYDDIQVRRALELGGEPLGVQELGDAFRRGIIDRARFNRGIIQGPIRNEWFDVLEQLQFHRMSTVDAADAVNQGHMSLGEGERIAHENGLMPEDFATLIKTAGQPPGIDFATEAYNRELINDAEFREMFLESRIKNRYLPLLEKMRKRIIPQETVRLLYRNGVYSREDTLRTLLHHGFTPDDAAALITLEEVRQDDTTRELTRSQIVSMYDEQILDAATTRELLRGMGYSEPSVDLMMALADVKRTQRFVNAAITRVRSAYLTGKIDDAEASMQLDSLRVSAGQRDELLTIWDIDRLTISKTLTPSQIRQAFKKDLITRDDAMNRLVSQGYDQIDAGLFLELTA